MLEKPDLQEEDIGACLQNEFGLLICQIDFLPLGADLNTAVYRAVTEDETAYFVKLRRGSFNESSVALPKLFSEQGIKQIIAPLACRMGQLWARLNGFKLILYPFIAGHNGYEIRLSERHWGEFGTALKRIHTAVIPAALSRHIKREAFSAQWRDTVKMFLERVERDTYAEPAAIELAAFLRSRRGEILDLVGHAERLAAALRDRSPAFIVCHSDIHAGNILIGSDDALYIIDWDEPILAPKERDLMYVGGGLMGGKRSAEEEEMLFYETYGQTEIDTRAMAYYRYERIVEDIGVYCEQLLLSDEGGEDREQSLHYLKSNFNPNSTIEIAYRSDMTVK